MVSKRSALAEIDPNTSKRQKTSENRPALPRLIIPGTGKKLYAYHILAAYAAYTDVNSNFTIPKLEAVSPDKIEDSALTIVHHCGHKWCVNIQHLDIKTKRYNDEQVGCHRGLQSATDQGEYETVHEIYCRHPEKCWSIAYEGEYKDDISWQVR
ncbi:MAG: hypothetical protein Q9170_007049 [Blastenia crenularia]